jgi:tRNA (guanosine-2'-O-)-methyltransferase
VTVVLENLYQDHNISAVLRTCDGLGIQDVHIIEKENAFRVNEEVALGASRWLSIFRYNSENETKNPVEACLESLRQKSYTLVATVVRPDALSVWDMPADRPVALLFGTELTGLSPEAISRADMAVYYPMEGFTDSFNVSVSAALFLQAILYKMKQQGTLRCLTLEEQNELVANWLRHNVRDAEALLK